MFNGTSPSKNGDPATAVSAPLLASIENAEILPFDPTLPTYKNVPDDFWDLLRKAYKRAPKLLLKEAQAAASLNALLTIADSLIAQRSSASGKK